MPSSRKDWFPTPIWHFILDDCQQLNETLLQEIKTEQQRDRTGEKWSNILGWHSVSNLHQAGTMLLFPSWLLHGVEMNMSGEPRISLSFNIGMSPIAD